MRTKTSEQTKKIDRAVLAECRKQLGRNFVSLICTGSRANGDELPDSDYDGFCFVRDLGPAKLDLSAAQKSLGVRLGVGVRPLSAFMGCVAAPRDPTKCPNRSTMAALKMGRGRVAGGRDLLRLLPPLPRLLRTDWKRDAQRDYWLAVLPGLPCNVFRREPRRHVGFIVAICDALLLAKGIAVRKSELPSALKRHHPRFHVIRLLRRALRRRAAWPDIGRDRREISAARRDLRSFLKIFRKYVFAGDGSDLTPDEARGWRQAVWRQIRA